MASSTSHFKSLIPFRALALVLTALAAWIASALYTVKLNPEMAFFRKADSAKRAWARTIDSHHQPKVVVYGGSSCMTTIIPERMMEQHGLAVLNMGLHAGMGPKILTRYAIQTLQPGDTLIVAIEPDLLTLPLKSEPEGIQFCFVTGNQTLLRDTAIWDWPGTLLDLRPGGYHVLTLMGKIATRQPLYRYGLDEIHPDGWQEVTVKREFGIEPAKEISISNDAKKLLAWIHESCATHHVRLAYSLPWCYCPADDVAGLRRRNLDFMRQISEFIPVLKEPGLGVQTNRDLYADTPLHLTREGATLRTDELADQIQHWNTWTPEEIKTALEFGQPAGPPL